MGNQNQNHSYEKGLSIDIDCIVKDVLKQWWVILLVMISAALLAGAYEKMSYRPTYTASTTFAVSRSGFSSNLAYDNLRSAETMTTRFSQIVGSSVLKKQICEELGLAYFDASVRVWTVPESNLMTMSVTAGSPRDAYRIIHAVMDGTLELSSELMSQMAVKVLLEPSVPVMPVQAMDATSAMKKAGILAAAAMTGIFALLSYLKDTVKNPREVSAKLDTRLLGSICHEKKYKTLRDRLRKKKLALNINNPAVSFSYVESVQTMATRVRAAMEKKQAQVLLVTSVSENEGKSTVAANLGLALSREGQKVVLIDCDFRKPSQYKLFEIPKDTLEKDGLSEQLLGKSTLKFRKCGAEDRLWLLCNAKPFQNFLNQKTMERLKLVIDQLRKKVDYVIIDTSPMALVSDGEALAEYAQATLVVVKQDLMEAKYINDVLDQLNRTNAPVIGCVFNNVQTGFFEKRSYYGGYYGQHYEHYYRKQSGDE